MGNPSDNKKDSTSNGNGEVSGSAATGDSSEAGASKSMTNIVDGLSSTTNEVVGEQVRPDVDEVSGIKIMEDKDNGEDSDEESEESEEGDDDDDEEDGDDNDDNDDNDDDDDEEDGDDNDDNDDDDDEEDDDGEDEDKANDEEESERGGDSNDEEGEEDDREEVEEEEEEEEGGREKEKHEAARLDGAATKYKGGTSWVSFFSKTYSALSKTLEIHSENVNAIPVGVLKRLAPATVANFSSKQISELSEEQISALTPAQVKALDEAGSTAILVNGSKLHLLSPRALRVLADWGIFRKEGAQRQIDELATNDRIKYLGLDFVVGILSITHKNAETFIGKLTAEQLDSLATYELAGNNLTMTNGEAAIREVDVSHVSADTLGKVKPETIAVLKPKQLGGLGGGQLGALTPDQVGKLTKKHIEALVNSNKLHLLSSESLAVLEDGTCLKGKSGQIGELAAAGKAKSLSTELLCTIPSATINDLGKEVQKSFIGQLTVDQLNAMAGAKTGEGIFFGNGNCHVSNLNVSHVSLNTLRALKPETIVALKPEQLSSLGDEQLGALTPEQVGKLSGEHIKALVNSNKLHLLSSESLAVLEDGTCLKGKSGQIGELAAAGKAKSLSTKLLCTIPSATINDLGGEVQKSFIGQLTVDQLNAMAEAKTGFFGSSNCHISNLNVGHVSPNTLGALKPETIVALKPKQLGGLGDEQLGALISDQVGQLNKEHIEALVDSNKLHLLSNESLVVLEDGTKLFSGFSSRQISLLVEHKKIEFLDPKFTAVMFHRIAEAPADEEYDFRKKDLSGQLRAEQLDAIAAKDHFDDLEFETTSRVSDISAVDMGSVLASTLGAVKPKTVAALKPEQLAGLTGEQLAALTPDQAGALTERHIGVLIGSNRLHYLSGGALQSLGSKIVLKNGWWSSSNGKKMEQQLTSLVKDEKISFLAASVIGEMASGVEGNLEASVGESLTGQLTAKQLNAMSAETIGKIIKPDHMGYITPEVFGALGVGTIGKFSCDQITALADERLGAIAEAQAGGLTARQINVLGQGNRLQLLKPSVLRQLSEAGKITATALGADQLTKLVEAGRVKYILKSLDGVTSQLKDPELIKSLMETDFDLGDGNIKIEITPECKASIKEKTKAYSEYCGRLSPISTDTNGPEAYVGSQIDYALENESVPTLVTSFLKLIIEDPGKDSEESYQDTILKVLEEKIDSSPRDVYGSIDRIEMLKAVVVLAKNDKAGANGKASAEAYLGLKREVEFLLRGARYNSIDKYFSTLSAIQSLMGDENLDLDYRVTLGKELIEFCDLFLADIYGRAGETNVHNIVRAGIAGICRRHAVNIMEQSSIDPGDFGEKIKTLEKNKKEIRSFNSGELKCLGVLARAANIDVKSGSKGVVDSASSYLAPVVDVVRTAAISGFVIGSTWKYTKKSPLTIWLTPIMGFFGIGWTIKKAKDAVQLIVTMAANPEERKNRHITEREMSKKKYGKSNRLIVFLRKIKDPLGRVRIRFNIFLVTLFRRKDGKGRKSLSGFKNEEYILSKEEKANAKQCEEFRKNCIACGKDAMLVDEKNEYLKHTREISRIILESPEPSGSAEDRLVGLIADCERLKRKMLEQWLIKKELELKNEFPELRGTKKSVLETVFGAFSGVINLVARVTIPTLLNVASNVADGHGDSGQALVGLKKIAFMKRLEDIRKEYNTFYEEIEKDKVSRVAKLNKDVAGSLEELEALHEERIEKLNKSFSNYFLGQDAPSGVEMNGSTSTLNLAAEQSSKKGVEKSRAEETGLTNKETDDGLEEEKESGDMMVLETKVAKEQIEDGKEEGQQDRMPEKTTSTRTNGSSSMREELKFNTELQEYLSIIGKEMMSYSLYESDSEFESHMIDKEIGGHSDLT